MAAIKNVLLESGMFSFFMMFDSYVDKITQFICGSASDLVTQSRLEENQKFLAEFITVGAANLALVESFTTAEEPSSFPRFPISVKESHVILSVYKENTYVCCARYQYALLDYEPSRRLAFLREVLDNFMVFSGDIAKWGFYAPQLYRPDLRKAEPKQIQ